MRLFSSQAAPGSADHLADASEGRGLISLDRRLALLGGAALLTCADGSAFGQQSLGRVSLSPNSAARRVSPCKFGSIHTRAQFYGTAVITGATGLSLLTSLTAESDFDFVRLVFHNRNTTIAYTINSIAVAASAGANDYVNPVNSAGAADNTLWQPVYCNNAGAFGDIPSPTGTTRSLTVPAAMTLTTDGSVNNYVMGIAATDWIPVQSLARIDGGSLPFLFMRSYASTAQPSEGVLGSVVGGSSWDPFATGRILRASFVKGDTATSPGTVSGIQATTFGMAVAVQFLSRRRGLCVLTIGDSLVQGYGTSLTQNDPFQIAAAALSSPIFPIVVNKLGYQGMGSAVFSATGYTVAAGTKPDVMFIKSESPNDAVGGVHGTAALYEASIARGFAMADWATRQGAVPVLMTAQPWGYSGASETARQAFNAAIRAAGWLYIDWDLVFANPASPSTILPVYNSTKFPLHYNDAGSAVMAQQQVVPVIAKIMAARPF